MCFFLTLYHNAQIDYNLSILSCVLLFDNKGVTKQLIARYCLHYMIFNLIRRGEGGGALHNEIIT